MDKKEVQQRLFQNGKPIPLEDFFWDEERELLTCNKNYLEVYFQNVNGVTLNIKGHSCTLFSGNNSIVNVDERAQIRVLNNCVINTGDNSVIFSENNCVINTEDNCRVSAKCDCVINLGDKCKLFLFGDNCKVKASGNILVYENYAKPKKESIMKKIKKFLRGIN